MYSRFSGTQGVCSVAHGSPPEAQASPRIRLTIVALRAREACHRVLGEEARRSLDRVAAHAASLARASRPRALGGAAARSSRSSSTHATCPDNAGIARWALEAASRISGAKTRAFVRMRAGQLVCEGAEGIDADELLSQAAHLLQSALRRPVPLVISDTSTDRRFALGPRFARGSIAAIPVAGTGAVLFTYDALVDGVSSTDLELLVMLGHQLSLLHARSPTD